MKIGDEIQLWWEINEEDILSTYKILDIIKQDPIKELKVGEEYLLPSFASKKDVQGVVSIVYNKYLVLSEDKVLLNKKCYECKRLKDDNKKFFAKREFLKFMNENLEDIFELKNLKPLYPKIIYLPKGEVLRRLRTRT